MKALTRADKPAEVAKWTQDSTVEIEALKRKVEDLETDITRLKARVTALEEA